MTHVTQLALVTLCGMRTDSFVFAPNVTLPAYSLCILSLSYTLLQVSFGVHGFCPVMFGRLLWVVLHQCCCSVRPNVGTNAEERKTCSN